MSSVVFHGNVFTENCPLLQVWLLDQNLEVFSADCSAAAVQSRESKEQVQATHVLKLLYKACFHSSRDSRMYVNETDNVGLCKNMTFDCGLHLSLKAHMPVQYRVQFYPADQFFSTSFDCDFLVHVVLSEGIEVYVIRRVGPASQQLSVCLSVLHAKT